MKEVVDQMSIRSVTLWKDKYIAYIYMFVNISIFLMRTKPKITT